MPCHDSASTINIRLDAQGRLLQCRFTKIPCGRALDTGTGLSAFCQGKSPEEILHLDYRKTAALLDINADEEGQFLLSMELDVLQAGLAKYLGIELEGVDIGRCQVLAVQQGDGYTDITLVVQAKSFLFPAP